MVSDAIYVCASALCDVCTTVKLPVSERVPVVKWYVTVYVFNMYIYTIYILLQRNYVYLHIYSEVCVRFKDVLYVLHP